MFPWMCIKQFKPACTTMRSSGFEFKSGKQGPTCTPMNARRLSRTEFVTASIVGRVFLCVSLFWFAITASAAIYKCETNGKVSYSEDPCPVEAAEKVMENQASVDFSETGTATGWVDINDRRMEIKGAAAVWHEDREELWVYLFPFEVDHAIREQMREARGNGHQFRYVETLNPDPDLWEQTPFVEFHFLFNDANRRVLETVRHSRFVSWHEPVPTTLNYPVKKSIEKQLYQQLYVTRSGMAVLSSRSTDTFVDRLYAWNVQVQLPLRVYPHL